MSMHKKPLTDIERDGLKKHGLAIDKPSMLSDAFRLGVAWALEQQGEPVAGWKLVPIELTPKMLAALWAYKQDSLADCYRAMLAAAPAAQPVQASKLPEFCSCKESHPMECEGCRANREAAQPVQGESNCYDMPHGWVVNWPHPNGGTKPVYHPSAVKPKFGEELDGKLTMYPVYTHATPTPSIPQPDARKVIEQMVDALGLVASTYGAETPMWAQSHAAIQAGQQWMKEHK